MVPVNLIISFYFRQCLCILRDAKNFERFSYFSQAVIYLAILEIKDLLKTLSNTIVSNSKKGQDHEKEEIINNLNQKNGISEENRETWNLQEKEKFFNFISKLFLMNFPLYQVNVKNLNFAYILFFKLGG